MYYALCPQGNMTEGMEFTGHLLPVPMIRVKGTLPSTFTQRQLTLFSASSGHVKSKSPSFTSQSSFSGQDEATFSSVSTSISLQVKLRSSCKSQHLHQSLYLMLVLTLSQWSSWGICLSVMWRCITGWLVPDNLSIHSSLIFKGLKDQ